MSIEDFEFVTLSIDTEIKPFVCRDEDLNQFLLDGEIGAFPPSLERRNPPIQS